MQERLDRGLREAELEGDLGVVEPLPLAENERVALPVRQAVKRSRQIHELFGLALGRGDRVVERRLRLEPAAAEGRAAPREADVARDREQPGRLRIRDDAALERAEGVQERRLEGVLRVLAIAQTTQAERVDLLGVALKKLLRVVSRRPPRCHLARVFPSGRFPGEARTAILTRALRTPY